MDNPIFRLRVDNQEGTRSACLSVSAADYKEALELADLFIRDGMLISLISTLEATAELEGLYKQLAQHTQSMDRDAIRATRDAITALEAELAQEPKRTNTQINECSPPIHISSSVPNLQLPDPQGEGDPDE
jgi:hypothetical protein